MTPPNRASTRRPGARDRALDALAAVRDDGRGSQAAVDLAARAEPPLSATDRGLLTELVYGVLRWQRRLDRWLAAASDRGLRGVDPAVLDAMRLGAYQLAALDRIPDHAAIGATLDAARSGLGRKQIGYANAVLRRLARERPWQGDERPGLPPWILQRIADLADALDLDRAAVSAAFDQRAPLHVHVTAPNQGDALARLSEDGVEVAQVGELPGVFEVLGGSPFAGRAFQERRLIAQDAASAAVVAWVPAEPGTRVLDLCAGRGAKSLFLAARGAEVTAVDIGADRLEAAARLADRAGHPLAATLAADASAPLPLPEASFDAVLCDAPCSGLGTMRRRPEIRARRRAADLPRNHVLQLAIARQAARMVKPGGTLTYAVCSFADEEGPLVVDRLLAELPDFARVDSHPAWLAPLCDRRGDLRSHPLWHGADAFYAAQLQRR